MHVYGYGWVGIWDIWVYNITKLRLGLYVPFNEPEVMCRVVKLIYLALSSLLGIFSVYEVILYVVAQLLLWVFACNRIVDLKYALLPELPSFLKTPMDLTIRTGTVARLECAAEGHPPPQIAWQKDGGINFPAARERRMHVMPEDDTFFIANVKAEDMGVYSCTAKNEAGSLSANATLTVLGELWYFDQLDKWHDSIPYWGVFAPSLSSENIQHLKSAFIVKSKKSLSQLTVLLISFFFSILQRRHHSSVL